MVLSPGAHSDVSLFALCVSAGGPALIDPTLAEDAVAARAVQTGELRLADIDTEAAREAEEAAAKAKAGGVAQATGPQPNHSAHMPQTQGSVHKRTASCTLACRLCSVVVISLVCSSVRGSGGLANRFCHPSL